MSGAGHKVLFSILVKSEIHYFCSYGDSSRKGRVPILQMKKASPKVVK